MATPSRSDTMAPFVRDGMAPCHGAQPSKSAFMVAVPRVSVRKCERKPISPRDGTRELDAHAAAADVVHASS